MMSKQKENINNNVNDYAVSVAKSMLNLIPFVETFLSELTGNIIPNQRIDRLAKYVQELDEKISRIPIEKLNELLENENFVDLIEESLSQAARAISDERRYYISEIVKNGILPEDIKILESKFLLKLLSELNDIEIIWLRYFLVPTMGGDEEFRDKHKSILRTIYVTMGSDEETRRNIAIQNSYKEHLERLNLIYYSIKTDTQGVPEYDFSGNPKKVTRIYHYIR